MKNKNLSRYAINNLITASMDESSRCIETSFDVLPSRNSYDGSYISLDRELLKKIVESGTTELIIEMDRDPISSTFGKLGVTRVIRVYESEEQISKRQERAKNILKENGFEYEREN